MVEQVAAEQDRPLIDLRLLLMEPTDLRGIPYKTEMEMIDEQGIKRLADTVRWAPPEELPRLGFKDNAVLFLDELPSASPVVQAASYQLILNRRIGAYQLPDGVDILAAGNRTSDKGVTYRMPTPLANRFLHCTLINDFEEWKTWAINSGKVHADIIAYHIDNGGRNLMTFNPKENKEMAFATPRSWVFASDMIQEQHSMELTKVLVSACIGEGLATEFLTFRKIKDQLPRSEDILSGKVKTAKITDISAKYLVIINLCHTLKNFFDSNNITKASINQGDKHYEEMKGTVSAMCDNFVNFVVDNFEEELKILGLRTALYMYKLPFPYNELKTFDRFADDYRDFII
jgi:hypothetical protein